MTADSFNLEQKKCPTNSLTECVAENCRLWNPERNECCHKTWSDAQTRMANGTVALQLTLERYETAMDRFADLLAGVCEKLGVELEDDS